MEYLEQHLERLQQESIIQGNVYGPVVAAYVQVQDETLATILEKAIPLNRLMGFIVETQQDAKVLSKIFRQDKRLRIDFYTILDTSIIQHPRFYHKRQLEEFQQFGIQGYLCDQFHCPDIIRAFLYSFQGIQHILYGQQLPNQDVLENEHFQALSYNSNSSFNCCR
jgi:hypothetical protein